jgi:hypothetical protein
MQNTSSDSNLDEDDENGPEKDDALQVRGRHQRITFQSPSDSIDLRRSTVGLRRSLSRDSISSIRSRAQSCAVYSRCPT